MTNTLQCDKFSFLLIKALPRLIADSKEEASSVSITVSAPEELPSVVVFCEGIDN